jgi:hypothetical protein
VDRSEPGAQATGQAAIPMSAPRLRLGFGSGHQPCETSRDRPRKNCLGSTPSWSILSNVQPIRFPDILDSRMPVPNVARHL